MNLNPRDLSYDELADFVEEVLDRLNGNRADIDDHEVVNDIIDDLRILALGY